MIAKDSFVTVGQRGKGETGRAVAAHLRHQIRLGDLDAVSNFLEKVRELS